MLAVEVGHGPRGGGLQVGVRERLGAFRVTGEDGIARDKGFVEIAEMLVRAGG